MTTMMLGLLFGAIGMGYFAYGKKMQNFGYILIGIVLMVFPYFFEGVFVSLLIGSIISISPFIFRRFF